MKTKKTADASEVKDILLKKNLKLEKEKEKYWIKEGICVKHVDYPNVKMRVIFIKKVDKQIFDGTGNKVLRKFTLYVECQWLSVDNEIQKAKFTTRELQPCSL